MIPGQDIWGIGEIAETYGITDEAVRKWRLHPEWPEPCAVIGRQLVWRVEDIRAWVSRHRPKRAT